MRYILASASPRRRELIRLLGLPFEVQQADVDEEKVTHPNPAVNAMETARLKATTIAATVTEPAIVVGADTIVALGNQMLGKPAGQAEAWEMLRALRGRSHQVHSGLAVVDTTTGRTLTDVASVQVSMRPYSDAEIAAYIASGDPFDKAGGYAIQHPQFRPVSQLRGCYAAVVGLPLCHLARLLRELDIPANPEIAAACQRYHQYDCPVSAEILGERPGA